MIFLLTTLAILLSSAPPDAAAALGAPRPVTVIAPRPVIVVLHGRGHGASDSSAFRRNVLQWMQEGARAATGTALLREDDVRLVWYADLTSTRGEVSQRCVQPETSGSDSAVAPFVALAAFAGSLFELAEIDSGAGSRELRSVVRDLRYFSDPALRCAADKRVADALARAASERRPVVLVAYSFGGLLAWNHLNSRTAKPANGLNIVRLVTVGSPVASSFVRQLVFGDSREMATLPNGVGSWVNIVDTADPFAAPIAPGGNVDAATGMSDVVLRTGRTNPHDLQGYLEHRTTVDAVMGAWCGVSGFAQAGCATFTAKRLRNGGE